MSVFKGWGLRIRLEIFEGIYKRMNHIVVIGQCILCENPLIPKNQCVLSVYDRLNFNEPTTALLQSQSIRHTLTLLGRRAGYFRSEQLQTHATQILTFLY